MLWIAVCGLVNAQELSDTPPVNEAPPQTSTTKDPAAPLLAQPPESPASTSAAPDPQPEAAPSSSYWVLAQTPKDLIRVYGFIDGYLEKAARSPTGVGANGEPEYEQNAHEFDVLNAHLMIQGTISKKYRYYLNLAAPGSGSPTGDDPISLRNAWVEAPIYKDRLLIRVGKTYRRFGLYNEILDATPTFIGIEPPELFDKDHLIVTRTTNLMLHGRVSGGSTTLQYAVMTGNDERAGGEIPVGADLRVDVNNTFLFGSSFYTTNGDATPTRLVGEGPPVGGVASWMATDRYSVFGGFAQVKAQAFQLQGEYWRAPHEGVRDLDQVALLADAGLNEAQAARFGLDDGSLRRAASYDIETWFFRAGFPFRASLAGRTPWEFTPYAQWDYYSNPEIIAEKDFGGDNEAGIADDNKIHKATIGLVLRPVTTVALKVDLSDHLARVGGGLTQYPEVRASFSYFWELEGL